MDINKTLVERPSIYEKGFFKTPRQFEVFQKLDFTSLLIALYFFSYFSTETGKTKKYKHFYNNELENYFNQPKSNVSKAIKRLQDSGLFFIYDIPKKGKVCFENNYENAKFLKEISIGLRTLVIEKNIVLSKIQVSVEELPPEELPVEKPQVSVEERVVSVQKLDEIPITIDSTSLEVDFKSCQETSLKKPLLKKPLIDNLGCSIESKTDGKIQAEISNVNLKKENKLDEKFILDSTKEIILNQENNQVEKKEVSKNTFNQNKTFQQFKSSQNSINQNRTTQDKELEEKIIKRLKDIGLTQIELIIQNYSLQHIQKHLVYFNYQDEQKAYILYNSIKFDLAPPSAYIRYKRLKALEPLFERWQPVLREYYIPATGLEKLDDALIEMSYKIIDKIDDIQSYKSSLIDGKEKKGSLYNSAIKFFKNILAKLDYNEILEIFNEYISNKNYRSWHYKLRYFSDEEVRKYLNSVKQIRSYSELPEH